MATRSASLVVAAAAGAAVALVLVPVVSDERPTAAALATVGVLAVLALLALLALVAGVALGAAARRTAGDVPDAGTDDAADAGEDGGLRWTRAERRAAAHEVKGPLAVAMGHVELVAEDPTTSTEHRETLEVGLRNLHRTLELVDALLAGSATGTTTTEGGTDLAGLAREAVEDIAPLAVRRQVAVSLDATGATSVAGDPSRLRQVVDNLLSNAVKYADDAGWADVLVAAEEDRVLLQVTNGGTTLTAEEAERALEAEFRGAATTDSDVPGAGIGLSVVHAVVTDHGGEVELTSDVESGTTTVRVLLPRA